MITMNGNIIRTASAKVTAEEVKASLADYEIELSNKQFQLLMLGEEIDLSVTEETKQQADPFATPNKGTTKANAEVVSFDDGEDGEDDFGFGFDSNETVNDLIEDYIIDGYFIMGAALKRGNCTSFFNHRFVSKGKVRKIIDNLGKEEIKFLKQMIEGFTIRDCGVIGTCMVTGDSERVVRGKLKVSLDILIEGKTGNEKATLKLTLLTKKQCKQQMLEDLS